MENTTNGSAKSDANFEHKSHNDNNGCSADNSNESITTSPETYQIAATVATLTTNRSDGSLTSNDAKTKHIRKGPMFLHPQVHDEMVCGDISATTEDIKRLKHVQVRSNSTGKLYQSSRRVSFPENDSELVTGYLEPADPWACG